MSEELKACPFCGCEEVSLSEIMPNMVLCSNIDCYFYAVYTPVMIWQSRPIEDELRAEIVRLKEDNEKWRQLLKTQTSIFRDLTNKIEKLKEDAERLASTYVVEVFPHEWVCRGGCHHWARFGEQIDHAPDCPVTLHRQLMKEVE